WMLLNLTDAANAFNTDIPLSFIGVQKATGAGQSLPKLRLNFRDYNINVAASGVTLTLPEDRSGKCFSCHPSGMRRLIDRRTTT
ncbi:hypothetical protein, partial [Acinetobacter sp. LH3_13]|uniref:hypothetical protein n=1 Tax=Acinetobacter sp. LH3_13 TaxID=3434463 RepID=UPI003EB6E9C4